MGLLASLWGRMNFLRSSEPLGFLRLGFPFEAAQCFQYPFVLPILFSPRKYLFSYLFFCLVFSVLCRYLPLDIHYFFVFRTRASCGQIDEPETRVIQIQV